MIFLASFWRRFLACALLGTALVACEREVPQNAVLSLQVSGKELGADLQAYRGKQGRWPEKLSDLVQAGIIDRAAPTLYPRVRELNDWRDLLKPEAKVIWEEWIYHMPPTGSVDTPLLIAPTPYTHDSGRKLEKPQRIIIKVGTPPQSVNDEDLPSVVQMLEPK